MEYLGKDTPKLGFGLMRLPMLGEEVDLEQTKQMVDKFLEAGFTYFDTAYGYLGGKSEEAVKTALVDRYPRESFQLATKLPAWAGAQTAGEAKEMLQTSLRRTGAGYFDFYLLHNCGDDRTQAFDKFGIWDYALEMKEKGLLKHVGFSFHDKADVLDELLTKHPEMEFVQLQINYADWESHSIQSRKCYEVARKHGKPVIVMEPVKGGMLATPPEAVAKVLTDAEPDSTPSSWALRFAADLDGIITVLSGMSNVDQMRENISVLKGFQHLTDIQRGVIARASEILSQYPVIPCTTCDYCAKVCPKNIGISGTFYAENMLTLYGNLAMALGQEGWLVSGHGKARANECIKCGKCEDACPQHIAIRERLDKAIEDLKIQ